MKKLLSIFALLLTSLVSAAAQTETLKVEGVKVNGLVQAWLVNDTTVTAATPNFRIRRGEIKLSGNIGDSVRAYVMADVAKTLSATGDNKVLQDLGVAVTIVPDLEITLGQFKLPTASENLVSSGELLFPERSLISRTYVDKREAGALITYKYELLKFYLALTNGQVTNTDDVDGDKDFTARVEAAVTPDIKVGVFTNGANFSYSKLARHGANVKFQNEVLTANLEAAMQSSQGNTLKSNGFVVEGAYLISQFQPAVRFEYLTPNTEVTGSGKALTLGVNYLFNGHKAKIQAASMFMWDMTAANGTSAVSSATIGQNGTVLFLSFSAML